MLFREGMRSGIFANANIFLMVLLLSLILAVQTAQAEGSELVDITECTGVPASHPPLPGNVSHPMGAFGSEEFYVTYLSTDNHVVVAQYDGTSCETNPQVNETIDEDAGSHGAPSVYIDGEGYLYVTYFGSHIRDTEEDDENGRPDAPFIRRSTNPHDVSEWEPEEKARVIKFAETYGFRLHDGSILIAPGTSSERMDIIEPGGEYRWEAPRQFITEDNTESGSYTGTCIGNRFPKSVMQPSVGSENPILYLTWGWAGGWPDPLPGCEDVPHYNEDDHEVFFAYSDDGGVTWRNKDNTKQVVADLCHTDVECKNVLDKGIVHHDQDFVVTSTRQLEHRKIWAHPDGTIYLTFMKSLKCTEGVNTCDGNVDNPGALMLLKFELGDGPVEEIMVHPNQHYNLGGIRKVDDKLYIWAHDEEDGNQIYEYVSKDDGQTWTREPIHDLSGCSRMHGQTNIQGMENWIQLVYTCSGKVYLYNKTFGDELNGVVPAMSADTMGADSVELSWAAPESGGQSYQYEIRYGTERLGHDNWGDATPVAETPTPAAPGEPQSLLVTGLEANTTYYFGITTDINDRIVHATATTGAEGKLAVIEVIASEDDGNVPENTVDNDLVTRWSAKGVGQWIQYDLGVDSVVDKLNIAVMNPGSMFEIEVSLDGENWTHLGDYTSSETDVFEEYDVVDTVARYVRLVVNGNVNNTWNSILEVEIKGYEVGKALLPIHSVVANEDDGNVPENTVDNDLVTRWSANGPTQWIRYDLGKKKLVTELEVAFYMGDERNWTFHIEAWDDVNLKWNKVYKGVSEGDTLDFERFPIDEVETRYVRLVGFGNVQGSNWNSYTEVKIYGDHLDDPATSDIAPDAIRAEVNLEDEETFTDEATNMIFAEVDYLAAQFTDAVQIDVSKNHVTITNQKRELKLTPGRAMVVSDGPAVVLEKTQIRMDGNVYIPVQPIIDSLGYKTYVQDESTYIY